MKKEKLILFTNSFPFGLSENNFIKFEIGELCRTFKNIEIINHKIEKKNNILNKNLKNIKLNIEFSKKINVISIILIFFFKSIFKKLFWKELIIIIFKKNFFRKLKMCVLEITYALILCEYLKKKKINKDKIIFYSLWSNYTLITFFLIKDFFPNSKFIARGLGSDLNGFIKDDDYIPYKKIKFINLDKLILLGEYQRKLLKNTSINKNNIAIIPLGVFGQKMIQRNLKDKTIYFLSCGNFIEVKNNILMIDFLNQISKKTKKKIYFIIIGRGQLEKKILRNLNLNHNNFTYTHYKYINNFLDFIKRKKINYFLNFSSQEGMPFTVMETMSIGIPTISSDIEPNKYLVENNGHIFKLSKLNLSMKKLTDNIINEIKDQDIYLKKCIKSYLFIKKNLINKNCHKKFKKILTEI